MKNAYQIAYGKSNADVLAREELLWPEIKKKIFKLCECSKNIMISIFDIRKKTFLSCSCSYEDLLGYRPAEIIDGGWKFWYNLIDPREARIIQKQISNFIFSRQREINSIYLNYHIKTPSGKWCFIKHELELYHINNEILLLNYLYDFSDRESIEKCLGKKINSVYYNNLLDVDISSRELEVLKLIANGFSSKQIADKLYISGHTATSHRKHLIEKFKVNNTAQLIKRASELMQL
ncbi:PAS domain-containing protein [Leptobacterium flavescens]|uniref:PAS domain-containing protein n=1 Tax=Leptobacterium flavescens TaxID=472055 RepID=A0A6P0UJE4_9FLAO|nr:LuxR C-terminal-related transcriptional regulator [Leptobacterium flavescens]NER12048.1 PAS domain-containing protein [Leptobacterium flavescens]